MPEILPTSRVNCFCDPGPVQGDFADFCQVLGPNEQVDLCERNVDHVDTPDYYITINSGNQSLIICALEKYIDSTTDQHNRRPKTDFLLIGQNPRNNSDVFVVFLEMRARLRRQEHRRDKIRQCKDAISLLCRDDQNYLGLHGNNSIHTFVGQINRNFGQHKVAAAIVPALFSDSRYLRFDSYSLGAKNIMVVPLADSWFRRTITWQQLLTAMGLV